MKKPQPRLPRPDRPIDAQDLARVAGGIDGAYLDVEFEAEQVRWVKGDGKVLTTKP